MSYLYETVSIRNGAKRTIELCSEECTVPAVVRGNPDRLAHVVSMIRGIAGDSRYPSSDLDVGELVKEWDSHKENPVSLRAAYSGAAVCAVCPEICTYTYATSDGRVMEESQISKIVPGS